MKKAIKKDAPRQARRTRALARFNLSANKAGDHKYEERKAIELAALKSALGVS